TSAARSTLKSIVVVSPERTAVGFLSNAGGACAADVATASRRQEIAEQEARMTSPSQGASSPSGLPPVRGPVMLLQGRQRERRVPPVEQVARVEPGSAGGSVPCAAA